MQFLCNKALRRRATPRLLHEFSGSDGLAMAWSASDLLRMQRQLRAEGIERFHSVQQFLRWHNELEEQINHPKEADIQHLSFPKPPIPGSENVIPLEAPDSLIEEAGIQCNCVTDYATRIASGGLYLYRVRFPSPAPTLSRR
jgi:hypothetical protein